MFCHIFVLCFIFFAVQIPKIECRFEFTNLKCIAVDKSYIDFEYCHIKAVNRTYKYISIKGVVFEKPVKEVTTNFALMKRNNGYFPFLYNITGPVCPFFKNRKRFPVSSFISGLFLEYSNFNHECPFNHDFILEKLDIEFLNYKFTKYLPFPEGNYLLNCSFYMKGIHRANVQMFFTLS